MKISVFKANSIKHSLNADQNSMAVVPDFDTYIELFAHGVPKERIGLLWSIPKVDEDGIQILIMTKQEYDTLKLEEDKILKDKGGGSVGQNDNP